ncbi:MAG: hypothetical protein KDD67_17115 [Ignavibacteriae bacterium]|nr:hypothetical protein [Ignavibacteriota bacterium]MCB9214274.1 hypothetical protein [Ignavibacteria bacterium]
MNGISLLILALLLIATPILAQDEGADGEYPFDRESVLDETDSATGPNLQILARSYGDSVVLRWGATTYTAWQTAGRGGFVLERMELTETMPEKPNWKRLNASPIRPLTIDEWKSQYRPEDTLAGAAVQTLYGSAIVTETDPFGSIYETYLQQQSMHGFAMVLADIAPRLANGYGLRYVDRDVVPGKAYLYRLYSLANDPNQPVDTAVVALGVVPRENVPTIETLTASEGEKLVVLKWYRFEHSTPFTGYYIERSTDGGPNFKRLKEIPFIPVNNGEIDDASEGNFDTIEYRIELERNYEPITYRVVGIDPFGDSSPSGKEITAMGRDMTPPKAPLISLPEVVEGNGIKIQWELPHDMESDLDGFVIGRGGGTEGPFEAISDYLPLDAREFTHYGVDTLLPGYYVVGAIDTAGNLRNSSPVLGILPDSIAPMIPQGLAGTIDSNGVVTLTWSPNEENDLQGYRVFFANQEDHEFQQLTTKITTDTIFKDTLTLQTLSEDIYYKVTALDWNFNHSNFTQTLKLKKPDVIAPVAPAIIGVAPGDRGVAIRWYRSPSGDAMEHALYRRVAGGTEWETLFSSADPALLDYSDSTAERGILYEYALDALDDDGNRSSLSNIVTARPYDNGVRAGVTAVNATYDSTAGGIVLRWSGLISTDVQVMLYKSVDDGKLALVSAVEGKATEYVDRDIFTGSRYRYGIKVVTEDGGESMIERSGEIFVR